jgi:hypothetical protein
MTHVISLFDECERAIQDRVLIRRASERDKEFHFQDWVKQRLEALGIVPHQRGRNSFPDFVVPKPSEGYEVKALAYGDRYDTYDSNSQPPTGAHGGWSPIYYVFGRYPKGTVSTYPVLDLVLCHGDFLNADQEYVHKNRHVRGFGSYGDIMIRDRRMYVVPTPYALAEGIEGQITLLVPAELEVPSHLELVGELVRPEADSIVLGYTFDLRTNVIEARIDANPHAGREHTFRAYRHASGGDLVPVTMRDLATVTKEEEELPLEYQDEDDDA